MSHAEKRINCGLRWKCVICLSWASIYIGSLMKVRTTVCLSHNNFCLSRSLPVMRSCLVEDFFGRQWSSNCTFLYGHTTFLLFSQVDLILFSLPTFLIDLIFGIHLWLVFTFFRWIASGTYCATEKSCLLNLKRLDVQFDSTPVVFPKLYFLERV